MKKIFLLAIASMMLFACQNEDQSQLSIDMLKDKATVQGCIYYNAGVDTTSVDNFLEDVIKPLAEQTVFIELPYSEINPGTQGNYIIETVTDTAGRYSVQVPTISGGVDIKVRVQEFTSYCSVCKDVKDGKPVFETDLYAHNLTSSLTNLMPGAIEYLDDSYSDKVVCDKSKIDLDEWGLNKSIKLEGAVELAYETEFRTGAFRKAANARVEFKVVYPDGQTIDDKAFIFNTMTDAEGKYNITLPLKSYEDGFKSLKVAVKGFGAAYEHYTAKGVSIQLNGAYKTKDITNLTSTIGDIYEGMTYRMPTAYVTFTPNYDNNLTSTISIPSTWEDNLAGWEKYDGFTETRTVTGKYLLAAEDAFGIGSFKNTSGEAIINIAYPTGTRGGTKNVVVPTAADGSFSFEVPVTSQDEVLTVAAVKPELKKIAHYLPDGNVVGLAGDYGKTADDIITIKKATDTWSELGDNYYKFTAISPDASVVWDGDLAAWMMPKQIKAGKKETITLTGKVYFPVQSSYAVGVYEPVNGNHISIKVGTGSDAPIYTFPVVNGVFTGQIPVASATEEPTLTPVLELEVLDYVHYKEPGKKQMVAGKYKFKNDNAYWTGKAPADRTTFGDLGDIYCEFTPTTAPDGWADFYQYLAGWTRRADAKKYELASGYIYKAVETRYCDGRFISAAEELVRINLTVNSVVSYFTALTDTNGLISVNVPVSESEIIASTDVVVEPYFVLKDVKYVKHSSVYKSTVSDLKYVQEFKGGVITGYTEWNNLGSIYYKPDGITTKFLGWENVKNKVVNGYGAVVNIKGAILCAKTKNDGGTPAGYWENNSEAKGATVTIDGVSYKVHIPSGSSFRIPYNVQKTPASLNVAVTVESGSDAKTIKIPYVYNDGSTSKTQDIYGYYGSGSASNASISADGSDFYICDKASLTDASVNTNKVLLNFKVTHPTTPSTLPDWGNYSSYLY